MLNVSNIDNTATESKVLEVKSSNTSFLDHFSHSGFSSNRSRAIVQIHHMTRFSTQYKQTLHMLIEIQNDEVIREEQLTH